jgi:hypothetical protein
MSSGEAPPRGGVRHMELHVEWRGSPRGGVRHTEKLQILCTARNTEDWVVALASLILQVPKESDLGSPKALL